MKNGQCHERLIYFRPAGVGFPPEQTLASRLRRQGRWNTRMDRIREPRDDTARPSCGGQMKNRFCCGEVRQA
jgi:hypothetical protein